MSEALLFHRTKKERLCSHVSKSDRCSLSCISIFIIFPHCQTFTCNLNLNERLVVLEYIIIFNLENFHVIGFKNLNYFLNPINTILPKRKISKNNNHDKKSKIKFKKLYVNQEVSVKLKLHFSQL